MEYRKYADDLTRFATGLVGPADAADIVSSAMISCLWSPKWAAVRDPRAYLYRAVLNQARSMGRSEGRRRVREQRAYAQPVNHLAEPRPEVIDAVASLSVRQRAVVFLTYWADLRPVEVGELLGISDGSVRRHLSRARKNLRKVLDD